MAIRSRGAVSITDMSRMPESDMLRVRGIGVAVIARWSTCGAIAFSRSLAETPKRCSSSTISSPRSRKATSFDSRRWVPMTMSTVPSRTPATICFLLFGGAEPGEKRHPDREGREPPFEDSRVLRRQHRGRNQDGDLLPVHRRFERGPERYLRLPEADVAREQPVHRHLGLHILEHVANRPRLVLGLGPFEGVLEVLHPRDIA